MSEQKALGMSIEKNGDVMTVTIRVFSDGNHTPRQWDDAAKEAGKAFGDLLMREKITDELALESVSKSMVFAYESRGFEFRQRPLFSHFKCGE